MIDAKAKTNNKETMSPLSPVHSPATCGGDLHHCREGRLVNAETPQTRVPISTHPTGVIRELTHDVSVAVPASPSPSTTVERRKRTNSSDVITELKSPKTAKKKKKKERGAVSLSPRLRSPGLKETMEKSESSLGETQQTLRAQASPSSARGKRRDNDPKQKRKQKKKSLGIESQEDDRRGSCSSVPPPPPPPTESPEVPYTPLINKMNSISNLAQPGATTPNESGDSAETLILEFCAGMMQKYLRKNGHEPAEAKRMSNDFQEFVRQEMSDKKSQRQITCDGIPPPPINITSPRDTEENQRGSLGSDNVLDASDDDDDKQGEVPNATHKTHVDKPAHNDDNGDSKDSSERGKPPPQRPTLCRTWSVESGLQYQASVRHLDACISECAPDNEEEVVGDGKAGKKKRRPKASSAANRRGSFAPDIYWDNGCSAIDSNDDSVDGDSFCVMRRDESFVRRKRRSMDRNESKAGEQDTDGSISMAITDDNTEMPPVYRMPTVPCSPNPSTNPTIDSMISPCSSKPSAGSSPANRTPRTPAGAVPSPPSLGGTFRDQTAVPGPPLHRPTNNLPRPVSHDSGLRDKEIPRQMVEMFNASFGEDPRFTGWVQSLNPVSSVGSMSKLHDKRAFASVLMGRRSNKKTSVERMDNLIRDRKLRNAQPPVSLPTDPPFCAIAENVPSANTAPTEDPPATTEKKRSKMGRRSSLERIDSIIMRRQPRFRDDELASLSASQPDMTVSKSESFVKQLSCQEGVRHTAVPDSSDESAASRRRRRRQGGLGSYLVKYETQKSKEGVQSAFEDACAVSEPDLSLFLTRTNRENLRRMPSFFEDDAVSAPGLARNYSGQCSSSSQSNEWYAESVSESDHNLSRMAQMKGEGIKLSNQHGAFSEPGQCQQPAAKCA